MATEREGAVRLPEAWPDEAFRNILRRSALNLSESQIVGVATLTREAVDKWAEAAYRAGQGMQPPSKADWGAFLRERHLLILEWTAEGQSPEQIAHALSMDPMQVQLIAMTPEESTRPHARPAGAPE